VAALDTDRAAQPVQAGLDPAGFPGTDHCTPSGASDGPGQLRA
jgi:hypothetical protein